MNHRKILPLILLSVVMISGCISLETRAELHRDKSADIEMSATSDTEVVRQSVRAMIKERFAVSEATLSESDDGFTYRWENVRPPKIDSPANTNVSEALDWELSKDYGFPFSYNFRVEVDSQGFGDNFGASNSSAGSEGSSLLSSSLSEPSVDFYMKPFGKITDTNGVKTDDGFVKFDMTENKTYYIEFQDAVWNHILTGEACQEQWSCSQWSSCSDGYKTRSCTASNECGTYLYRPPENQSCGGSSFVSNSPGSSSSLSGSNTEDVPVHQKEWYQNQQDKDITHLSIDQYSFTTDNWDADAEDDGFYFNIKPLAADDTVVPTDGEATVRLFSLQCEDPEYCFEYQRDEKVYTNTFSLNGSNYEVLPYSEEVEASHQLQVEWDDVSDIDADAPRYGSMEVTLTTPSGEEFNAELSGGSYSGAPLRPQ